MELQKLSEVNRQSVLRVMEVCNLDINPAIGLLKKFDFNVDRAIQEHFNPSPIVNEPLQYNFIQPLDDADDDPQQIEYLRIKQYKESGQTFASRYNTKKQLVRKMKSWLPKSWRSQTPGQQFKTKLQEMYKGLNKIEFHIGNFLENCADVSDKKFPFVVHFYSFKNYNENIKKIITNQGGAKFFNEGFWNLGIDYDTYPFERQLEILVDKLTDCPCIVILRVDITDQIVMLDKISLIDVVDIKDVKKRLNAARSLHIRSEMQETAFLKRITNQAMGIYEDEGMSFEKRLKAGQQRRLRKQQQKQLLVSNQLQKEKQLERQKIQEENKKKQVQKQEKQSKIYENRLYLRKELKQYEQGIHFKIRLPSGEYCKRVVDKNQKVEYLFQLIESLQECGFEDDLERKFEIMRPYDKLILSKSRESTLVEILGDTDSQNLIVNQLE